MSASLPCPNPARCGGAKSHRARSAAALACASARSLPATAPGAPPPSPAPATSQRAGARWTRAQSRVADQLEAGWAIEDEAAGWDSDSGQPHPAGAYTSRSIRPDTYGRQGPAGVQVSYFLDGRLHRQDGPAGTYLNADGSVDGWYYLLHGQAHRADGPAMGGVGQSLQYRLADRGVHPREVEAGVRARLSELGADPAAIDAWYEAIEAGHTRFFALPRRQPAIPGGDTPEDLVYAALAASDGGADAARATAAALAAGIFAADTLAEIATGRLPLSWAVAGS